MYKLYHMKSAKVINVALKTDLIGQNNVYSIEKKVRNTILEKVRDCKSILREGFFGKFRERNEGILPYLLKTNHVIFQ